MPDTLDVLTEMFQDLAFGSENVADDVVIEEGSGEKVEETLKNKREPIESVGFRVSRLKTRNTCGSAETAKKKS